MRFNDIVFGPIASRRLGASLGVNLLPAHGKLCNFDCIYCECGWNRDGRGGGELPSVGAVANALEEALKKCRSGAVAVDSITFSGNGEPTLHPAFPEMVDVASALRDEYCPDARISVLSNATTLGRDEILSALKRVDNPILKLDAVADEDAAIVNRPSCPYSTGVAIEGMKRFDGDFILQTMFLCGGGADMTEPWRTKKWIGVARELQPREIMAYTIDRATPASGLGKVSAERMRALTKPLSDEGFNVKISV